MADNSIEGFIISRPDRFVNESWWTFHPTVDGAWGKFLGRDYADAADAHQALKYWQDKGCQPISVVMLIGSTGETK